jgi:hypothetical protein
LAVTTYNRTQQMPLGMPGPALQRGGGDEPAVRRKLKEDYGARGARA